MFIIRGQEKIHQQMLICMVFTKSKP